MPEHPQPSGVVRYVAHCFDSPVIRAARLERQISQEALADAAGIDRSHLGKIERGERNVSLLNVARVCDALEMSIAALMASAGL